MGSAVHDALDTSSTVADDVAELARELIRRVVADADAARDELLDVELGGVRCLLVRVHKPVTVLLSPREHEIARMVALGYPNKTIASVLEISTWTVSTHLRRIFAKFDVHTRAAMVARLLNESSFHTSATDRSVPRQEAPGFGPTR